MKVIVIGGAGYIGSHAVLALLQEGNEIIVFDSFENGHKEALDAIQAYTKKDISIMKGDIKKRGQVKKLFDTYPDADVVLHFAAYIEVGESVLEPLKYYFNNTIGTINVLAEMGEHHMDKIVFSSTAAVYGAPQAEVISEDHPLLPINPYGKSKFMVEQILDDLHVKSNFSSIRLRYFNVVGSSMTGIIGEEHPGESHLIPRILMGITGKLERITIYGDDYETSDGTCIRDYIYIEDLIRAHILALKKIMKEDVCVPINLGSRNGYSVRQVIEVCRNVTNIEFREEVIARRAGDPAKLIADSTRAREVLGWEPKTDLHTMIATAWKWISTHPDGYKSKN